VRRARVAVPRRRPAPRGRRDAPTERGPGRAFYL
jgi:hypothetical protein